MKDNGYVTKLGNKEMNETYDAYTETGYFWLEEIPTHWDHTPVSHLAEFINGYGFSPDEKSETGLPIVRIEQLRNEDSNTDYFNGNLEKKYKIESGNLLLSWSASLDVFRWERGPAWLNQHIFKVKPGKYIEKNFLYYSFKHLIPVLDNLSHGSTMKHIKKSYLKTLYTSLPPISEQKAIVKFLDRETSKIDRLIEKQEKLIDLLEKKRKAIIALRVTRGVNSDNNYQTSAIEWLEEIPSGWKEEKLKQTVEGCINGKWGSEPKDDEEDTTFCLRVADFDFEHIGIEENGLTERVISEKDKKGRVLEQGDLLLEKSGGGEKQPVGRVVVYNLDINDAITSNFIGKMPVKEKYNSEYLGYLHKTLYEYGVNIRSIKQTTGIQNIDTKQYLDEIVPIPPPEEQEAIVKFLDRETSKIDRLIEKVKKGIDTLNEYGTALISAAVTGKIDVRGEV